MRFFFAFLRPVLGLTVGALLVAGPASAQAPVEFTRSPLHVVTAKGRFLFTVEMAETDEQRELGLQNRKTLAPGAGMLFDFKATRPVVMWMKNTLVSLDMLFIAADGRIVRIAENTVPHSLATVSSGEPVRAVLEVTAGTARRLDIRPGSLVVHRVFGNAPAAGG